MKPPELLTPAHKLLSFDCGRVSMNDWLGQRAMKWQSNNGTRVMVLAEGDEVVAYYSLSSGSVRRAGVPKNMGRNNPDPIPVIVLGRLAVDQQFAGKGIATDLMLDAFDRVYAISHSVGVVAVVVHALEEELVGFYEKLGFRRSPQAGEELTLFKAVKDIDAEIRGAK